MRNKKVLSLSVVLASCILMFLVWYNFIGKLFGENVSYTDQNVGVVLSQILVLGMPLLVYFFIDSKGTPGVKFSEYTQTETRTKKVLSFLGVAIVSGITIAIMFLFRDLCNNMSYVIFEKPLFANQVENNILTLPQTFIAVISLGIITPIFEELFFRWFLIGQFSHCDKVVTGTISVISFVLTHNYLQQIIYIIPMAIICSIVYINTKRILFPILIHAVVNITGIFVTSNTVPFFSVLNAIDRQSGKIAVLNIVSLFLMILFLVVGLFIVFKFTIGNKHNDTQKKQIKKDTKFTIYYSVIGTLFILVMIFRLYFIFSQNDVQILSSIF